MFDLVEYKKIRKKESIQAGLFYSIPISVVIFLFLIPSGFLGGLLFGVFVFVMIFGFIYLIREITHKGVDRRLQKESFDTDYILVRHNGEFGALLIYSHQFQFVNLNPGGQVNDFIESIDEELFIGVGPLKYGKLEQYRKKGISEGYVFFKHMPNGLPKQFQFYDIENALDKVIDLISKINKYKD